MKQIMKLVNKYSTNKEKFNKYSEYSGYYLERPDHFLKELVNMNFIFRWDWCKEPFLYIAVDSNNLCIIIYREGDIFIQVYDDEDSFLKANENNDVLYERSKAI